jgi:hypothetical protein
MVEEKLWSIAGFDTTGSATSCNGGKPEKRKPLRYGSFATHCKTPKHPDYHS